MLVWDNLSAFAQDLIILMAFLLPAGTVGGFVLNGLKPFPLVKAMIWRFRWANTLFVFLIAVSVGIGIALLAQERGLRKGSAASAEKFDLVVASPGSEVTMLLAAVYLQASDVPLLSGEIYERVANHESVSIAAPLGFGDSYNGFPIIGTIPAFVDHMADGNFEGNNFTSHTSAVIGSKVSLNIGDHFEPAHGMGDTADDEESHHDEAHLTVVGRMAPTGTPWDKAILIPIEKVWEVHDLPNGHAEVEGGDPEPIGPPFDPEFFPGTPAIIVHTDEIWANYALRSEFASDPDMMAFFPGSVLVQLYGIMGDIRQAMSLMSLTTQILVSASVFAALFILIRLFQRQLALLRALGAPKRFVFAVVWSYASLLLLAGAVFGLLFGQVATIVLSRILTMRTDIALEAPISWPELHLVAGFVSLSSLLALVPAAVILRQKIVPSLRN